LTSFAAPPNVGPLVSAPVAPSLALAAPPQSGVLGIIEEAPELAAVPEMAVVPEVPEEAEVAGIVSPPELPRMGVVETGRSGRLALLAGLFMMLGLAVRLKWRV